MMGAREAPARLLEELREILPAADLVDLGNGEWLLGHWAPFHRLRYQAAVECLDRELSLPVSRQRDRRIALLRHFLGGFRYILPNPDSPILGALGYRTETNFGRIREELREKEWGLHRARSLFEAHLKESVVDHQQAISTVLDRLDAEHRSDWRILRQGRRSIKNPRNWN